MPGLQLTADCEDCRDPDGLMADAPALGRLCRHLLADAGLQVLGERCHAFEGGGVTALWLLAESHLAVHTWPELRSVSLDLYVCNWQHDHSAAAQTVVEALVQALGAGRVQRQQLERGPSQPAVSQPADDGPRRQATP